MNYSYKIYSPSGNDTALIMNKISSKEDKKIINDIVMKKHSNVEQVGFMYTENGIPTLEMAGGEFCGNASRCMVYEFLGGKVGDTDIKAAGTYNLLKAGIDSKNNVWCEMPLKSGSLSEIIKVVDEDTSIVSLAGITHIVKRNYDMSLNEVELKEEAMKILESFNFLKTKLAAGVIFADFGDKINIKPIVWVGSIDTVFYENACGTGTVATGIDIAYRTNKNVDISVFQPSGAYISCSIEFLESDTIYGKIGGKVDKLYEGYLSYSDFKS